MALRLRKDVKKSSYYVWFLGAKESKGLRGSEFALPAIQHLVEREKDVEPFKVTLQVSHKGLKIIQNVLNQTKSTKPKNETIKHFIPHNSITCVYQHEDIIACILLLFNPVTKCPLHVHAYRCDSLETAALLKQQLQTLVDRTDNQKKFAEIENRLSAPPKEVKKVESSSVGSDTGTSTRESESSEERFNADNSRVATLYDSVAAELRAKLNRNSVPILLPPRDYDTVHRQKGNLTGIELRRCLNTSIVGHNVKGGKRIESSGGSSGIGSDHPPSPDSPDATDTGFNTIDNQSTSDEEWHAETNDATPYLFTVDKSAKLEHRFAKYDDEKRYKNERPTNLKKFLYTDKEPRIEHTKTLEKDRYIDVNLNRSGRKYQSEQKEEKPRMERYKDNEDDENFRYNDSDLNHQWRVNNHEEIRHRHYPCENTRPIPKLRQKLTEEPRYYADNNRTRPSHHYYDGAKTMERTNKTRAPPDDDPYDRSRDPKHHDDYRRSPSPDDVSPRDRFKDAKEKFLLLEKDRLENGKKEEPISPTRRERHFMKRHESMAAYAPKDRFERYEKYEGRGESRSEKYEGRGEKYEIGRSHSRERFLDEDRYSVEERRPKPAPRVAQAEDVRYRKYDPKRHSMFNLLEEEHRQSSFEIAKELKRRSYLDGADDTDYSKSSANDLDRMDAKYYNKNAKPKAGVRHSYAEPKLKIDKTKKHYPDIHRTNSSLSNSGRVGIASVHPY